MVRVRYKPSLVFRLSLVLSMVKFKFSLGIQKTTSLGKSYLKNKFLRSGLPCKVIFRPKNVNTCGELELTANQAEPENQDLTTTKK